MTKAAISLAVRQLLVSFLQFDDLEDVGPTDAFLDLGTDSRQAVEFKMILERSFCCQLRTTVLFEHPTVDQLVDFLASLPLNANLSQHCLPPSNSVAKTVIEVDVGGTFPLAETQKGLWYISESTDFSNSFNVPLLFKLKGSLDRVRFLQALRLVLQRHPALCVRFHLDITRGELQQTVDVADTFATLLTVESTSEALLRSKLTEVARGPFDLSSDRPLRVVHGSYPEGELLLIVFHHIVIDGLSAVPWVQELWSNYQSLALSNDYHDADENRSAERDTRFFNFLNEEQEYLCSDQSVIDKAYWSRALQNCGTESILPIELTSREKGVDCTSTELSPSQLDRLKALSRDSNTPVSTVLLTLFNLFLYRISGVADIVVTTPVSGRPGGERGPYRDAVGCFINLVATRCTIDDDLYFHEFCGQVREQFLEAIAHSQLPFALALQSAGIRLSNRQRSSFPISFTYQNIFEAWDFQTISNDVAEFDYSIYQQVEDDLTLEVYDFGKSIQLNWKFQRQLLDSAVVSAWAACYSSMLEQVLANHHVQLNMISFVCDSDTQHLSLIDRTSEATVTFKSIIDWFDNTEKWYPTATAIVDDRGQLTYAELKAKSEEYCIEYQAQGARPGMVIPIFVDRNLHTIARILGVLRSGAAYMPIDPTYPQERIEWMVADSQQAVPPETAYVLFTSGSTGRPKAVPIRHGSLVNLCHALINAYALNTNDRVIQFASLTFDMSIEEIFPLLCVGGAIILRSEDDIDPERFYRLVLQHKATILNLPPAYFQALRTLGQARCREIFNLVRLTSFGGDQLTEDILSELKETKTEIFNAYGPTETTVNATVARLTNSKTVHIGTAFSGVGVCIIDRQERIVPIGVAGELCIFGIGVSDGYLTPDISKLNFRYSSLVPGDAPRQIYFTGDRAMMLSDGNIRLRGRIAHQISLRGHRIEPGEIERALLRHPDVVEAAVALHASELVAVIVLRNAYTKITIESLADDLRRVLPLYMIPSRLLCVDILPTTKRGKLDRASIAAMIADHSAASSSSSSDNHEASFKGDQATWESFRELLTKAFGRDDLEPHHSFLTAGGHSLLAILLVAQIRSRFRCELTLRDFLRCATFADVCTTIEKGAKGADDSASLTFDSSLNSVRDDGLELSPSEARLWFLDQLGHRAAYKIPVMADVSGTIDCDRLERAIAQIVKRHPPLRTQYRSVLGMPQRAICNDVKIPVEHHWATSRETAIEMLQQSIDRPFDLQTDTLLRVSIAQYKDDRSVLSICFHHIVSDAWSMQVFLRELAENYDADCDIQRNSVIPSYAVYRHEVQSNQTDADDGSLDYWVQHFGGFDERDLQCDYDRPVVLSDRGSTDSVSISAKTNQAVQKFCATHRLLPSSFWLAVVYLLLRKRGNGDDQAFGIPVIGRNRPEQFELLGFFVNTIALRINPFTHKRALDTSIVHFIHHVNSNLALALQHQNTPIEQIFDALKPDRRTDRSPLFQVLFNYAPQTIRSLKLGDAKLEAIMPTNETAKFELSFSFNEMPDGTMLVATEYLTELFRHETIGEMHIELNNIVEQVLECADLAISQLKLPATGNPPTEVLHFPRKVTTFAQCLDRQILLNPDHPAIEYDGKSISYEQLKAELTAHSSSEHICGQIIAPERTIATLLQCVSAKYFGKWFTFEPKFANARLPVNTAYVLTTSGSTGEPKGVVISNAAMDYHNDAFHKTFQIDTNDRVAQYAHPTFDLFIEEVFPTLRAGATVVGVPETMRLDSRALTAWISHERITVLDLPTSVFHLIAEDSIALQNLVSSQVRLVVVGGEVLISTTAMRFINALPQVELWNTYGPTEATIICTTHRVSPRDGKATIPIGQPFANAQLMVVDADNDECGIGVIGELVIAGPGLADGYLFDGEIRQSQGFRVHPFDATRRAYWTGDLVKRDSEGRLIFCGRNDDEIKVRGKRVNLGNLRRKICSSPLVEDAAVVTDSITSGARIIAAVQSRHEADEVRRSVSRVLGNGIQPNDVYVFQELPLTARGKIDRAALRAYAIAENHIHQTNYRNEAELQIAAIWAECLGHSNFTRDDDFFSVGGHSLLASRIVYQINARLGGCLTILDLFRLRTIELLVAELQASTITSSAALARKIVCRNQSQGTTIVLPGLPGYGDLYWSLAEPLLDEQDVVLMTLPGLQGDEVFKSTADIATQWCDAIESISAREPLSFVAHSFSGAVLHQMLRINPLRDKSISSVILLDSWPDLSSRSNNAELVDQWLGALPVEFAEASRSVISTALSLPHVESEEVLSIPVHLVITAASRPYLSTENWSKHFQTITEIHTTGDHSSVIKSPHIQNWLNQIFAYKFFQKADLNGSTY